MHTYLDYKKMIINKWQYLQTNYNLEFSIMISE